MTDAQKARIERKRETCWRLFVDSGKLETARDAAGLVNKGMSLSEAERRLDLKRATLSGWCRYWPEVRKLIQPLKPPPPDKTGEALQMEKAKVETRRVIRNFIENSGSLDHPF